MTARRIAESLLSTRVSQVFEGFNRSRHHNQKLCANPKGLAVPDIVSRGKISLRRVTEVGQLIE